MDKPVAPRACEEDAVVEDKDVVVRFKDVLRLLVVPFIEEEEEEVDVFILFEESVVTASPLAAYGSTSNKTKLSVSVLYSHVSLKQRFSFRPPNTTIEPSKRAAVWKARGAGSS